MTRLLAAIVAVVLAGAACNRDSRIDEARGILGDDDRFETGAESASAFARVTGLLRAEADACIDDSSDENSRCQSLLEASAFAQVTAVAIRRCTRPDRDDVRRATARYLSEVDSDETAADRPEPPPPPRC